MNPGGGSRQADSTTDGSGSSGSSGARNERTAPFSPAAPPPLNLPKSGGAIRAIGETFKAGGPTGTGSLRVPLPVSPGRDGVQPALALAYDSGQGAGPLGIGWAVDLPSITRRTDKGVPRYADDDESDIFILSGQEDLVPVLTETATREGATTWTSTSTTSGIYRIDAYRPRVEGLFARIERWTHTQSGDVHWRSITADNVTSLFGLSTAARVMDPANPLHVFKWCLEATFDDRGHATLYEYKREDTAGVSASDRSEATRITALQANCYPKFVYYGNATPLATRSPAYTDLAALSWYFLVVFDYGEHTTDLPAEVAPWALRQDPFSTYRSGFEIRTYRLCQRVLMFHTIPNRLGAPARLVKALKLTYDPSPTVTYLTSARLVGYAWDASGNVSTASMPAMTFDYTRVGRLSTTVQTVDAQSSIGLPIGIDGGAYQIVDLDGEGIAGVLTAPATPAPALQYKRNLGQGRLAGPQRLPLQPSTQAMAPGLQLVSLNGDGRLDVAQLSGPMPGFFERNRCFAWNPYAVFQTAPKVDWSRRGVHMLDVDGDGLTDILVAEDNAIVWYPSLSRAGYDVPRRVTQTEEEGRGPTLLTTDDYETIFLADMTGDGLEDVVRVRNGDIVYWPNLGYGHFGAKVAMKSAPIFDRPDLFDPRRIRFGDIDGTGNTDIVYLSASGAVVYLNQSGNGWAPGVAIPVPPQTALTRVRVADFLGTGTACIVWSSQSPADARSALRYVDLLSSTKPHLLSSVQNGVGAQTTITYAPSTRFYLQDRAAGHPWATRLPFVVQTVARVETIDQVASTRSVSQYRYAHGFYDGVEREFRGFARVDSWDAEFVSDLHGAGPPPGSIVDANGEYDLPPIHTIQWIHTGAWDGERDDLRRTLSAEFFAGDPEAPKLPDTIVPFTLGTADLREAYRALKGKVLREEVYADDGSTLASIPYAVTEHRYEVRQLQPIDGQRHGVYQPIAREDVGAHYERNAADPRIEHTLYLEIDALGHVRRDAKIGYARRTPAQPEQGVVLATCRITEHATVIDDADDYRHGVPTEVTSFELALPPSSATLPLTQIDAAMTSATVLPFDGTLAAGSMRTLEHVQHLYYLDDLSGPAPLGTSGTRALVYDHQALSLPATLVASVYGTKVTAAELTSPCGYLTVNGDSWSHAGVTAYDAGHFYQATSFTDPFGNRSSVVYDAERLFVVEEHTSQSATFDNVTAATIDYRVLAPSMITDPNGNQTAAMFDPLGLVIATAVMGRPGANEGDTLANSSPTNPGPATGPGPTTRVVYDLLAWEATPPSPTSVHTYARLQHGAGNTGWFETVSYSDGSGREILKKAQAEPDATGAPRWVGTGRTAFDNKGNAVKRYEPYFASDDGFDTESSLVATGYSQILRYDPLSRLVRTDFPDGTFSTVVLGAWQVSRFDANDNVLQSQWYASASALPSSDPLNRAASLAAACANTPEVSSFDPLGRTFLSVADNGGGITFPTRTKLDVQGNAVAITDANGVVTLSQTFDPQGHVLASVSVDAGASSSLADGTGKPYRAWDARGYERKTLYDVLHRPTQIGVTPPTGAAFLAECLVYGEGLTDSSGTVIPNFRGHLYQHFDAAGVLTNQSYDLENHVTHTTRQLAVNYTSSVDWSALASLTTPMSFLPAANSAGLLSSADTFDTLTTFDALGRVVTLTTPDQSATAMTYGAGSLLASVATNLRGGATATPIVTSIAYNAMRQRTSVTSGAGVNVQYTYDDRTHVIARIYTTPASGGTALQDLNYTYDPVHNVVQVTDNAQDTIYFGGNVTTGTQQFTYDPTYRLVQATGREQPGQVGFALGPNGYPEGPLASIHPNNLQAMLAYTESYQYDPVGNLLQTLHQAAGAGWTRTQTYLSGTNRLNTVSMPGDPASGPYSGVHRHDAAGNIVQMPNLATMTWDHAGRLVSANLGGGGTAYFVYDAAGNRVRKVIARSGQFLDRVYVGEFERYRELAGTDLPTATITLERQSLHVHDGERRFALLETNTVDTSAANFTVATLERFQFPNHVGSACLETDPSGTPISYEEYYPFGGSSFRSGDSNKRYRFADKERDEETGLYYFGVRHYAPWLGRWISTDPSGFIDGPNIYAYVKNAPTSLRDLRGLEGSAPWYEKPIIWAAEGAAWLMGESAANAPETAETPTYAHVSDAEFAARVGLTVASGGIASATTKGVLTGMGARVVSSGAQRLVASAVGGAAGGATLGIGSVGIHDAAAGQASSAGTYLRAAGTGALVGGALAGAASAIRTTLTGGAWRTSPTAAQREAPPTPATPSKPSPPNAVVGAFGREDVAFGLARAGGKPGTLVQFAGDARPGTQAPLSETTSMMAPGAGKNLAIAQDTLSFARAHLRETGGSLRFNLEGFNYGKALTPGTDVYNSVTSAEFRGILADPFLRGRTTFYSNGVDVTKQVLSPGGTN